MTYVYDANDPERHPLAQGSEALCAVVAAGKPIFVKNGRFGPYVQLGTTGEDEKPKNASLLKGMTAAGARIVIGLPPLISMFNSTGTAYAATTGEATAKPIENRFVLWFNGNGIPER